MQKPIPLLQFSTSYFLLTVQDYQIRERKKFTVEITTRLLEKKKSIVQLLSSITITEGKTVDVIVLHMSFFHKKFPSKTAYDIIFLLHLFFTSCGLSSSKIVKYISFEKKNIVTIRFPKRSMTIRFPKSFFYVSCVFVTKSINSQ